MIKNWYHILEKIKNFDVLSTQTYFERGFSYLIAWCINKLIQPNLLSPSYFIYLFPLLGLFNTSPILTCYSVHYYGTILLSCFYYFYIYCHLCYNTNLTCSFSYLLWLYSIYPFIVVPIELTLYAAYMDTFPHFTFCNCGSEKHLIKLRLKTSLTLIDYI